MTTYLQALENNDCVTARALGTATFQKGNGELRGVVTVTGHTPLEQAPARAGGEVVFQHPHHQRRRPVVYLTAVGSGAGCSRANRPRPGDLPAVAAHVEQWGQVLG